MAVFSVVGVGLVSAQLSAVVDPQPASAASASQFDPGLIISDQLFFDSNAMSQAQIQAFLDAKIGTCSNQNCLNILRVDTVPRPEKRTSQGTLVCLPYAGGTGELASAVIFKVQQACGISAKALLVTLQKEQGLVTKKSVTAGVLERAMGYGCPDNSGGTCLAEYYGFGNQMYWAAWQLKRYGAAPVFGAYQQGVNTIQWNPDPNCGASSVLIQNRATAALYNYTPYQPNAAALNNLYGVGDSCSSYGNRNFFVHFNDWFGSTVLPAGTPEGSLDVVKSDSVGTLTLSGWAIDPDAPTATVTVSIQVNSNWYVLYADKAGDDLSGRFPGAGSNHAFSGTLSVPSGSNTLCVYLGNQGAGVTGSFGCQKISVLDSSPQGEIRDIWTTMSGISLWGWAADQDAPDAALDIRVIANGATNVWVADQPWEPIADLMAGVGIEHGWGSTLSVPAGDYNVCVIAINQGAGSDTHLGCSDVTVPSASPVAEIEAIWGTTSGISLWGWAIDPDVLTESSTISIRVGSNWYAWSADQPYLPAKDYVAGAGENHGWGGSIATSPGSHLVCLWVGNRGLGSDTALGCHTVVVPDGTPKGEIRGIWTSADGISLWGWAMDADVPGQPIKLSIQVDSNWYVWDANQPYAPAQAFAEGAGPNHGWGGTVPATAGPHTVCVYPINQGAGSEVSFGCRSVVVPDASPRAAIKGLWTSPAGISLWGWAIDPDSLGTPVPLSIQVDSSWYTWYADQPYAPAQAYVPGAGLNHGWGATAPATPGRHTICVYPVNQGQGHNTSLGCYSVTVPSA